MKWRNSKERELIAQGGCREQTLPTKHNPNPDLSDPRPQQQQQQQIVTSTNSNTTTVVNNSQRSEQQKSPAPPPPWTVPGAAANTHMATVLAHHAAAAKLNQLWGHRPNEDRLASLAFDGVGTGHQGVEDEIIVAEEMDGEDDEEVEGEDEEGSEDEELHVT